MRRAPSRGQALVEFALVFPVFVLMLFGIIDGARLVFAYNSISQAAQEGARRATVQAAFIGKSGASCTAPVCPTSTTAFHDNIVAATNAALFTLGPLTSGQVQVSCTTAAAAPTGSWTGNDCASGNGSGNVVSVRVAISFSPLLPFGTYPLGADTTMTIP